MFDFFEVKTHARAHIHPETFSKPCLNVCGRFAPFEYPDRKISNFFIIIKTTFMLKW